MGVGRLRRGSVKLEVENFDNPEIKDFKPKNGTIETRSSTPTDILCHTWYLWSADLEKNQLILAKFDVLWFIMYGTKIKPQSGI